MNKIGIIGAGNIGTRHLQGLIYLKQEANIYIYDISEKSLKCNKEMCENLFSNSKHQLFWGDDLKTWPKELDLVIVATTADVRRDVINKLLIGHEVRYFILEKVLFQKIEDYEEIKNLFLKKNIQAWVNCPMRIYPSYKRLKKKLDKEKQFTIKIRGTEWGLCCNTIHYLDLISFLTDNSEITVTSTEFYEKPFKNKRKIFYEVTGKIMGVNGKCKLFEIESLPKTQRNISRTIQIETVSSNYLISEKHQLMSICGEENDWKIEIKKFEFPYQSQIAAEPVNEILRAGICGLPTYQRSMMEHLLMIEIFKKELFEKNGIGEGLCPIT